MRKTGRALCGPLGAAALALALGLEGCGQAPADDAAVVEGATEAEAAAAAESETDTICVDEEVGLSSDLVRSALASAGSSKATDLSELPQSKEEGLAIETGDTVSEGTGDQSKAASDTTLVTCGGIEVQLPSTWQGSGDESMQVFLNDDASVIAIVNALAKDGQLCDVASVAAGIPATMGENGYQNVQIVQHDNRYSDTGELVSSFVLVTYERDGHTHVEYYGFLESKNYVNGLYVVTDIDGWKTHYDDISAIIGSVSFVPGESL